MAGLNIQIERFIPFEIGIIDAWMDNPMGFHFQTAELEQFRQAVASNPSFGREHPLFEIRAGISHSNFAYREVGRADSLHIILRFNGRERSVIHLDSVSIAVGRDKAGIETIRHDAERALGREEGEAGEPFAAFAPVKSHKSRQECVLLPIEALQEALT